MTNDTSNDEWIRDEAVIRPVADMAALGSPAIDPVALLRDTVKQMRERAKAATPGPWLGDPTGTVVAASDVRRDKDGSEVLPPDGPMEVAECYRNETPYERGNNAAHIASWHPAVALTVADWIDTVCDRANGKESVEIEPALAVARAYAGGGQ